MASREYVHDRQARAANNQGLFREVNERVKDLNDHFLGYTVVSDWVCECAHDTCAERLELTSQQYESIRSYGERFFVAPSDEHVFPEAERVVERHATFWVVEKLDRAADVARDLNPRSDGATKLRT